MKCFGCHADLDGWDIGAYRKLVHREAKEFLCRNCLAKDLGWDRGYLDGFIDRCRRTGCTLFPQTEYQKEDKRL